MTQSNLNRSLPMTSYHYQPSARLSSGPILSIADIERMSPEVGKSIVLNILNTTELGLPELEELVSLICKARIAGIVVSHSDARLLRLILTLNHLSYLALRSVNLKDISPDFLAALTNLEELTLIGQSTIPQEAFLQVAKMPRLRVLTIHDARLSDEVMAAILSNTALTELHTSRIRLRNQPILNGSILRQWKNAADVRILDLADWNVSADDFSYLADRFNLLESLTIGSECNSAGIRFLLKLSKLKSLSVSNNTIEPAALLAIGQLANLETLWMEVSSLTNNDLSALSNLHKLKLLSFNSTKVTPAGVFKHLHQLRGFLDLKIGFIFGVSPRRTFRLPKHLQKRYLESPVTGVLLAEDLQTHKIFFPELRPDSDFEKP